MLLGGLTAAVVILAGVLIGATGIGGVLVVPVLVALEGASPAQAVAASALAFACPGLVALWRAWHLKTADTSTGFRNKPLMGLVLGALSGAVLGALWVHQIDTTGLLAVVAAFAVLSGLRAWWPSRVQRLDRSPLGTGASVLVGALVGLGSGLTGTGGPVLLVPLLMALGQPVQSTVLAAQLVQLPIALSAGLVHLWSGALDVRLAGALGLWLVLGAIGGQWLATRLPMRHLPRVVAVLLVFTGLWMGARVLVLW